MYILCTCLSLILMVRKSFKFFNNMNVIQVHDLFERNDSGVHESFTTNPINVRSQTFIPNVDYNTHNNQTQYSAIYLWMYILFKDVLKLIKNIIFRSKVKYEINTVLFKFLFICFDSVFRKIPIVTFSLIRTDDKKSDEILCTPKPTYIYIYTLDHATAQSWFYCYNSINFELGKTGWVSNFLKVHGRNNE